jgi:tRNA(Ile)-lysidine synthase
LSSVDTNAGFAPRRAKTIFHSRLPGLATIVAKSLGQWILSKRFAPFRCSIVFENEFTSELEHRFQESFPPHSWAGCRVIVAVSGGPDSVALLHLLVRSGGRREQLVAGHVNHNLRGVDSDLDATFVADLCDKLGVKACIRVAHQLTEKDNGLEEAARRFRYAALRELAEREGARFVLTAHTADDQAETILYRLFRGTGLRGLGGIPRSRPFGPAALVRPLLGFTRQELVRYLETIGATYRRDATNDSLAFARNRVRHLVIPAALQVHPAALDGVLRLGEVARETHDFIRRQVEAILDRCVIGRNKASVLLDRQKLGGIDPLLLQEALIEIWRIQRWPMRNLTRHHILNLRDLIVRGVPQGGTHVSVHLPGQIEFEMDEHQISLRCLKDLQDIVDED